LWPFRRAWRASGFLGFHATVFFPGVFLRAVCCSGIPAGLGQSSRASVPAAGGIRRCALRPWPVRAGCCGICVFLLLTLRSQSWRIRQCQGCASGAPSAARPALDVVPPGLHCVALQGEEKRRSNRQPPCGCQGYGVEHNVPPACLQQECWLSSREDWPAGVAAHSPAVKDQSTNTPFRLAGVWGRRATTLR
jgi:hypothetical protein